MCHFFYNIMTHADYLSNVDSVFRAFKKQIRCFDQIEIINSRGEIENKHIVVHTAGVFILETKTIIRSFYVSKIMPLFDLQYIHVSSTNFTIKSEKESFTIQNKNHIKIAAEIYSLRQILYPTISSNCVLQVEPDIEEQFEEVEIDYEPENFASERFLGMVYTSKISFSENYAVQTYKLLSEKTDTFVINNNLLSNPYLYEIIITITLDQDMRTIVFDSLELSEFYECFLLLSRKGKNIQSLIFKNMMIKSKIKEFNQVFEGSSLNNITEITFDKCMFYHQEVGTFFEAFTKLKSSVRVLQFTASLITTQALDSIFQMLFFSPCFHSLETLVIRDLTMHENVATQILQLLTCGWVLEKRCLKYLDFSNSSLNVGKLLTAIKDVDCGLLEINVSFNTFTNLSGDFSFSSLTNLILNHCTFVNDALFELFNCLAAGNHQDFLTLDLSDILCTPESLQSFYSKSSDLVIEKLGTLVWDGNQVTGRCIEPFMTFLKNQPNLTNLSLNRCFIKNDHSMTLPLLVDLLRKKSFMQFCLAASGQNGFGPQLSNALDSLISCSKELRLLDITNQNVGDAGLFLVLRQMNPGLQEFYFEGYQPSSVDSLSTVMLKIMSKKQLKKVSWPATDATQLIAKTSIERRNDTKNRVKSLHDEFKRYFNDDVKYENTRLKMDVAVRSLSSRVLKSKPTSLDKECMKAILIEEQEYAIIDEESSHLLEEMSSLVGTRPIISAINEIHCKTSIKSLLDDLGLN